MRLNLFSCISSISLSLIFAAFLPSPVLCLLLGMALKFGAAQVITFTLYHSFLGNKAGLFVSLLNTVTSGV